MYTFISEFCYELTWLLGGIMIGIALAMICNVLGDITESRRRARKKHKAGKNTRKFVIDGIKFKVIIEANKDNEQK